MEDVGKYIGILCSFLQQLCGDSADSCSIYQSLPSFNQSFMLLNEEFCRRGGA
jgi:hypothetical protein